jgi:hypothetical protein
VIIANNRTNPVLKEMIRLAPTHYNPACWNCIGPALLMHAMNEFCKTEHGTSLQNSTKCGGWNIYPSHFFNPVYVNSDDQPRLLKMHGSKAYSLHLFRAMFHNAGVSFGISDLVPEMKEYLKAACPDTYNKNPIA